MASQAIPTTVRILKHSCVSPMNACICRRVLPLDAAKLKQIIEANPLPEAETACNTQHFNFLVATPNKPDLAGIERIEANSERC